MLKLVLSRIIALIPLLMLVTTATYFLGQASPVDPAAVILGEGSSADQRAALREELGVDRPAVTQYREWVVGLAHGDFGDSYYSPASVGAQLSSAFPVTLSLAMGGLLVAILLGVPLGVLSGLRAGKPIDRVATLFASVGQAIPAFWLGLLLIIWLAIKVPIFPAVGYVKLGVDPVGWFESLVLPCISLGLVSAAVIQRQTRSAMIGVLQQEYIRTAVAKGMPVRVVIFKHALKNAGIPVITVISFQAATLLGGAFVIEALFSMKGMGNLIVNGVLKNDPNVVQGVVVVTAIVIIAINLVLDLLYGWLNPKVRI